MNLLRIMIGATCALLLAQAPSLAASSLAQADESVSQAHGEEKPHRPVLLVSIDGFSPDSLLGPEKDRPNLPVLRGLLHEGSHAERVVNVNPTVTNPNHTTLVTGVSPIEHGVFNNRPFAATARLPESYSQYEAIKVPTLWSAAKEAGLRTASLYWPVTRGAAPIDVNINNGDSTDDEQITREAIRIITEYRPHLLTVHYVSHDKEQHAHGPGSAEGRAALERIDREIGKLVAAYRAQNPQGVIAIASDHGFDRTTREVNLNIAFADAGLITFTDETRSEVKSWRAFAWYVGGSAMVVLQDPGNRALEAEVATFLGKLARQPEAGIAAILPAEDLRHSGLSDQARFVIALKPGYRMGNAMKGPFSQAYAGGSHGAYSTTNTRRDMHAALILVGEGIAANRNLGTIDMRRIAPTLAGFLHVPLAAARGAPLDVGE
ncbi:nucleotide pyrophosphatase family protein [Sphingobium sp. SYK-6]|uniref:alkaline phosphatase family protein n=1 Tax=Sphingobium sp. (strain NBRC 103272 / SYK-6) TaxID=627192 RepID=UPI000227711F|nr:ectonucleotide pyrophosphatase/phosphodiesterase [Sphingobium sp. SYK-6]BAK66382.1 nucleotide pyrophosphatase family protein [Sphingobium sp. SYK-6]